MNERVEAQSDKVELILPTKTDLYYGGRWQEGLGKRRVDVNNPATGKLLGNVADADAADVDAAVVDAMTYRYLPGPLLPDQLKKLIVAGSPVLAK